MAENDPQLLEAIDYDAGNERGYEVAETDDDGHARDDRSERFHPPHENLVASFAVDVDRLHLALSELAELFAEDTARVGHDVDDRVLVVRVVVVSVSVVLVADDATALVLERWLHVSLERLVVRGGTSAYVHLDPVDGAVELTLQVADVEATCVVGAQVVGHVFAQWQSHDLDVGDAHNARDDLKEAGNGHRDVELAKQSTTPLTLTF